MKKVNRPNLPGFPKPVLAKNPVTDAYAKKVVGGAPVAFSAQAGLRPGKSVVLNAQTLQSGFRTPYFIDEIRVSLYTEPFLRTRGWDPNAFTGLSEAVRILFQTGSFMFSADPVPVGLMAPIFSPFDYGSVSQEYNVITGSLASRCYSTVRWLLPKPLWMPAGDAVLANVTFNDTDKIFSEAIDGSDDATVNITVTYIGRLVPQGYISTSRDIPWLAWMSKRASTEWATSQTRFRNPFLVPAHVQRFTSRTYWSKYVAGVKTDCRLTEMTQVGQVPSTTIPFQELTLDDSRGYSIVSKYTPIGEVFDATRKVWTFGRELTSREQFNLQMRNGSFLGITPRLPADTDLITNVGLVGYRTETNS